VIDQVRRGLCHERLEMSPLTGIGRQRRGRLLAGPGDVEARGLGPKQLHVAVEHVPHRERWVPVEGLGDGRDGIAGVARELRDGLPVVLRPGWPGSRTKLPPRREPKREEGVNTS